MGIGIHKTLRKVNCQCCNNKIERGRYAFSTWRGHETMFCHIGCLHSIIKDYELKLESEIKEIDIKLEATQQTQTSNSVITNKGIEVINNRQSEFEEPTITDEEDKMSVECVCCNRNFLCDTDLFICGYCKPRYDLDLLWELHDMNKVNALDFNDSATFRKRFLKRLG